MTADYCGACQARLYWNPTTGAYVTEGGEPRGGDCPAPGWTDHRPGELLGVERDGTRLVQIMNPGLMPTVVEVPVSE